jgi:hypothetical protein
MATGKESSVNSLRKEIKMVGQEEGRGGELSHFPWYCIFFLIYNNRKNCL